MAELTWICRSPGYTEPLCDGVKMFFTRHPGLGDLLTPAGRVLLTNVTLDEVATEFPGVTFTARLSR